MTRFRLSLAFFIATLVSIWARPPQVPKYVGPDAARFAQVASESAARPITQWPLITLNNEPFYERPPLGMIIEAFAFRGFGASEETAVRLTQIYATLLALVVLGVPLALGAGRGSHYSLLGLLLLPGFWIEARNPVLEMPLTLTLGASILAAAGLYRICRNERPGLGVAASNCIAFALSATAAFLLDGPKALAAFVPLVYLAYKQPRMRGYSAFAMLLTVLSAALFCGLFELARVAAKLPPFIPSYLAAQWHAPAPQPTAFLLAFTKWYGAIFAALGVVAWRLWKGPVASPLVYLALMWCVLILVAFPLQDGVPEWYVHPVMIGGAWVLGEAFSFVITPRWERWVAFVTAVVSLGVALFV